MNLNWYHLVLGFPECSMSFVVFKANLNLWYFCNVIISEDGGIHVQQYREGRIVSLLGNRNKVIPMYSEASLVAQ